MRKKDEGGAMGRNDYMLGKRPVCSTGFTVRGDNNNNNQARAQMDPQWCSSSCPFALDEESTRSIFSSFVNI